MAVASIDPARFPRVGVVDDRFQSYNVEMVEVTGGRFWKPYAATTDEQSPVERSSGVPVGMDPELYQTVRSNLGAAVAYLTPQLGGIDTTMLSPTQREEMRRMNAAQLKQLEGTVPAEVIEALKPRAEALRKLEIELAGARMKGAGM